jgi:hypothetical protein
MSFQTRLHKVLRKDVDWYSYAKYGKLYKYYKHYAHINLIWRSYLKSPDKDIDTRRLARKTFKVMKRIYCRWFDGDQVAYDSLVNTIRKVGYIQCGIELKSDSYYKCKNICTIEQGKCGIHSKTEKRKIKIKEFLKIQFDPIGLRDMVIVTSLYT